jgi:tungstate transport system ATP-binding protein
MPSATKIMTNAYQLDNIKVFYQQKCSLDLPQLSIPNQQCIALLGDNGAGKSTLLNLLAFLNRPSQGQIQLSGQAIESGLSPQQRRSIGYVNQQPFLLTGSVSSNIDLALKLQGIPSAERPSCIAKALERVNLDHLAKQTATTLSGGELKRAAIARAIAHDPAILLLDEPFSHLDQNHIQQLEAIIEQLAAQKDKTIIFSTHDRLQGAALADNTINLIKGKVTKSPLLNVFHGELSEHFFDTGNIKIHTTSQQQASHIAIDPHEIIISNGILSSSMRNQFTGRLTAISEEAGTIHLTIDCGERFYAIISPEALHELGLSIGKSVCLSFKSTAVSIF